MNKQLYALISAVLMVAVGCAVLVGATDDSSAACTDCNCVDPANVTVTGSVNVYYYSENGWDNRTVAAYDLKQAVDAAASALGYDLTYTNGADSWVSGWDPSINYGQIATLDESSTFTVFVYNDAQGWIVAQDAIGWYRPFSDYASVTFPNGSSAGAANIALVPAAVTAIPAGTTGMIGLTQVTETAEYRYCFHLQANSVVVPAGVTVVVYDEDDEEYVEKTLTTNMLRVGIVIYGYGSDGYQALKNALPGQVNGQNKTFIDQGGYYTFYSWMDSVLGAGTVSEFGEDYSRYTYWASYSCDGADYLSFTLGYYSLLKGGYNPACGFTYHYEVSTYYW